MQDPPWFLWDVSATDADLRARLRAEDPDARAQWQAWVMAEARFNEVWEDLSLEEILRNWPHIQRHLGRSRPFWEFPINGWRELGFLPG